MGTSVGGVERWAFRLAAAAALITAAATASVFLFLAGSAWPLIRSGEILSVLGGPWRPFGDPPAHGIAPMIAGTLVVAVAAVLLALPAALGLSAFAHGVGPRRAGRFAMAVVHAMTGVPTVIYGFVSVFLLVPRIREILGTGSGYSALAAALTLALLVLPTMVLVLEARLTGVDPALPLACAALGLSPGQTHLRVLLPLARKGVVAALVLGLCRAMGDTLVALMVSGNAARTPESLLESVRTLSAHLALVLATDVHGPEYRSVAAAGLLLFLLTACLAVVVRHALGVRSSVLDHADRD